ncbi:MAG: preprotein translocase subunit YajC [Firmicutes bacterium]|jgi:preprotein translocase subunit YajC|nr:preprotein translocase subunit YajC [Bacillota bacterium]
MVLLQAQPAEVSIWQLILPFVVFMAITYLFLIRPQQVQQKKRREMLQSLRRGDKVVTVGGIHGEIIALRDDVVTLRIADGVDIKISRSGIGSKRTLDPSEKADQTE